MATKKKSNKKQKEEGVDRRGFLKSAGYTAAGAAAGAVILESGFLTAGAQEVAVISDPDAAVQTITKFGRTYTVLGGQSGMSARDVIRESEDIIDDYGTCDQMSAEYGDLANSSGRDARLSVDSDKVEKDRAVLENMFSENFTFTDPFGVVGSRETTVESILSGKIRKDSHGYPEETLQIFGNGTAVANGLFSMAGSMKVRYVKSGVVRRRDISGNYRYTSTYLKEADGKWRMTTQQMSLEPSPKLFSHGHPGEADISEDEL